MAKPPCGCDTMVVTQCRFTGVTNTAGKVPFVFCDCVFFFSRTCYVNKVREEGAKMRDLKGEHTRAREEFRVRRDHGCAWEGGNCF